MLLTVLVELKARFDEENNIDFHHAQFCQTQGLAMGDGGIYIESVCGKSQTRLQHHHEAISYPAGEWRRRCREGIAPDAETFVRAQCAGAGSIESWVTDRAYE